MKKILVKFAILAILSLSAHGEDLKEGVTPPATKHRIILPVKSFDEVKIYSVKNSDYSMEDILDGKFTYPASSLITKEKAIAEAFKRLREQKIREENLAKKRKEYMALHEGEEPEQDLPEIIDQESTLLLLPLNQVVFLYGVDPIIIAIEPERILSTSGDSNGKAASASK